MSHPGEWGLAPAEDFSPPFACSGVPGASAGVARAVPQPLPDALHCWSDTINGDHAAALQPGGAVGVGTGNRAGIQSGLHLLLCYLNELDPSHRIC